MKLFLYEWVTGGGLVNHHGPLPESLLQQGKAMIEALAADAVKISGCEVTLFRELRVHSLVATGAMIVEIDSRAMHDQWFDQLATESDAVLLLAPETDGILEQLALRCEQLGAKLISPNSRFIKIAADKQSTAERLTEAGVKTPLAVRLEPEDSLPCDMPYPAVIKPLIGAGSEDTYVVSNSNDQPPAHAWPRRLETFLPGTPVSVSWIADGKGNRQSLIPTRQRLSNDGRLEYLGGEFPLPEGLASRATHLSQTALQAMPLTKGYVGVDLILGSDPHGTEDYVIEINPRLTTSYIGLRHVADKNLVEAMLTSDKNFQFNGSIGVKPSRSSLRFDADGAVYFMEPPDRET